MEEVNEWEVPRPEHTNHAGMSIQIYLENYNYI
jgi:hypothetical protein